MVDHFFYRGKKKVQRGMISYMSYSDNGLIMPDNGGTRAGEDRRKLSFINRTLERRIIKERRSGRDRRSKLRCRDGVAIERRDAYRLQAKTISDRNN